MNEEKIAATIYRNVGNLHDKALLVLKILQLTKNCNITKVIHEYENLQSKKRKVAKVISSTELNRGQQLVIEQRASKLFPNQELIFIFETDPEVFGGFKIEIDDNVLDLTLEQIMSK